jgi:hypothetical protein
MSNKSTATVATMGIDIEHIPAYSPQARGRSERMFGTLQGRLPKELSLFGIRDIEAANRYIREVYLPLHDDQFAVRPQIAESAFVAVDPESLVDILCIEHDRVVARDNTVAYEGRTLQLPQSPARAHYVKANVKVREYPDGTLAVFHGPRRLARYSAQGHEMVEAPTAKTVTPCSPPSRTLRAAAGGGLRPSLTAAARGVVPKAGHGVIAGLVACWPPSTPMERDHVPIDYPSICGSRCVPEGDLDLRHR